MPIIYLYTLCWNEIDLLPYVVDYWKRLKITKAIVYDNGSTDGSIEYMSQFDFIEVRNYVTDGCNDLILTNIKNNVWKEARHIADFVIVCDLDEVIYCKDPENIFNKLKEENITICKQPWLTYISDKKPVYTPGKLLHEISPYVYDDHCDPKRLLFNPNEIIEMNYGFGAHDCQPVGNINEKEIKNLYIIHLHKNLSLEFFLDRYRKLNNRRSNINKFYKFGSHYEESEEFLKQTYLNNLQKAFNFNDYINADNN